MAWVCMLSPVVSFPLIITQADEVEVRLPYQTEEAINRMFNQQTTVGLLFRLGSLEFTNLANLFKRLTAPRH